jgi:hypothetical protein
MKKSKKIAMKINKPGEGESHYAKKASGELKTTGHFNGLCSELRRRPVGEDR